MRNYIKRMVPWEKKEKIDKNKKAQESFNNKLHYSRKENLDNMFRIRQNYGWNGKQDSVNDSIKNISPLELEYVPKFGTNRRQRSAIHQMKHFSKSDTKDSKKMDMKMNTWESSKSSNVFYNNSGAVQEGITNTSTNVTNASANAASSTPIGFIISKSVQIAKKAKDEVVDNLQRNSQDKYSKSKTESFSGGSVFLMVILIAVFLFIPISVVTGYGLSDYESLEESTEEENAEEEQKTIVTVAEQELAVSTDNIGGSKYQEWYGVEGNWCAIFVSWCANECGYIEAQIMPKECSVSNMAQWYKENGYWVDVVDENEVYYEPKAGDIIFFQNNMSHVGIVVGYDAESKTITTIEGNTGSSNTDPYYLGSQVKEDTYPINYSKTTGYGLPDYELLEESTEESSEGEE